MSSLPSLGEFKHFPIEIWDEIFRHVKSLCDLKNVSLTSKLFFTLSRKYLYKLSKTRVNGDQVHYIKELPVQNLEISQCNDEGMTCHLCSCVRLGGINCRKR